MTKREARELEDQNRRLAAAKARKAATMSPALPPKRTVLIVCGPLRQQMSGTDAEIAEFQARCPNARIVEVRP